MNRSTIRLRIALLMGGLFLLLLAGFSLFLYLSLSTQLYRALDNGLQSSAAHYQAMIEQEDGPLHFDQVDLHLFNASSQQDPVLRLLSPTGDLLDDQGMQQIPVTLAMLHDGFSTIQSQGELPSAPPTTATDNPLRLDAVNKPKSFRLFSIPITVDGAVVAYLQVGRDLQPLQETLQRLRTLLLIAEPVLVLLAALAGYWLAQRALAPIEAIRAQAATISVHELNRRLAIELPDDEVGRLARTFDAMLARLEASFHRQHRFTADASHELRTPLAIIRGEVDVTLEQERTPVEYAATLRSIGGETERMTRLVNDLLLLARSDAAELQLDREALDLTDLLALLVEQMQSEATVAGVTLTTALPASLPVWGDRDRLLQLFINLLENALIYAPGSAVQINGQATPDDIVITVEDTGPGIAAEHLPYLFERFYRVDKARSRVSGGSGLGLAIVQDIVHAHDGNIEVYSQVGEGTTFRVRLLRHSPDKTPQPN